jgi:hypothetical protein
MESHGCVQLYTFRGGRPCPDGHIQQLVPLQIVPAHDLQQAGVIGQSEFFGGARDVPVVALEGGDDDLPFRLCLEFLESPLSPGILWPGSTTAKLARHVREADGLAFGRKDHALDGVS